MKRFPERIMFLFFFLWLSVQLLFAQAYDPAEIEEPAPATYIGLGSGVENFTGLLGVSIEANLQGNFSLYGGLGLGSWGYKFSGGFKYYPEYPYRWAYCASISHATGLKD